jgi:hypothetical protein
LQAYLTVFAYLIQAVVNAPELSDNGMASIGSLHRVKGLSSSLEPDIQKPPQAGEKRKSISG